MARHSDGKNNYAFAPWVIIVAVLAVLALAIGGFFLFREGDSSKSETEAADTTAATSTEEAPTSTAAKTPASDSLAPYFDAVTQGVAEAATAVGAKGSQVALWNYSSPISATAIVGFRQNVAYGDAENVAFAVGQFGTGGVPQTRSAVVAALDNATDQTAGSGENTRVVLITTGTQQDMDDASFAEAAKNARGEGVSLSVVHIGDGEKDTELEKLADDYSTVSNPSNAQESIASAAGA